MERTAEQRLATSIDTDIAIKQVDIGQFTINYAVAGSGPPVLLLHGGNIGWGQWYPNISSLSKHFTVYAIDLPGAGRSTRLDFSDLDLNEDLVGVAKSFINKLNLSNISVIGSSIGGWITLKLALDKSISLNKLVLLDSLGFSHRMRPSDRLMGIHSLARLLSKTVLKPVQANKNIERFLRSVFFDQTLDLSPEFVDYFYETMVTSHNLLFISRLSSPWGMRQEFRMDEYLPHISNPTLVIWGDHDPYMPIEKNRSSIGLLPNHNLKILPQAGHIPSIEKATECNRLILEFLLETH